VGSPPTFSWLRIGLAHAAPADTACAEFLCSSSAVKWSPAGEPNPAHRILSMLGAPCLGATARSQPAREALPK
jgi:hypothetical protein